MNHIHIGTKDLGRAVQFYNTHFGFTKKFDHEPGIFLEDRQKFLLAIDPVDSVPELPDWFHIGFCYESENEVLRLYKSMRENGVRIARDLMHEEGEFASFYVFDPDGYKIEVSWHNE